MPFVLLHFHTEKGPAGTLHRLFSGLLPQNGGAVLPPVSWENSRLPIFSAEITHLERRLKIMAENKTTNRERLREITDGIEQGIKELFESEKYMSYLSVCPASTAIR